MLLRIAWLLVTLVGPPAPRVERTSPESSAGILQQLVPRQDGGFDHVSQRGGFNATIHPDGRVTFRDHALPRAHARVFGFDLTRRTPNTPDPRLRPNTLMRPQDLASLGDDPLVKYGAYGPPPILVQLGITLPGVTDAAPATHRAGAKQRFLDATAPLRTKLANTHRRANQRSALAFVETDLRTIWGASQLPATVRRSKIFERWDECAELETIANASNDDRERGLAGEQARRRIEAWVRTHLPQTGADAYTPAELQALGARRRSRQPFDPYVLKPLPAMLAEPR